MLEQPTINLIAQRLATSTSKWELEAAIEMNGVEEVLSALESFPSPKTSQDVKARLNEQIANILADGKPLKYINVYFINKIRKSEKDWVLSLFEIGEATLTELTQPIDPKKAIWYS